MSGYSGERRASLRNINYLSNHEEEEEVKKTWTTATASSEAHTLLPDGPSTSPESALARALHRMVELNMVHSEPLPTQLTLLDTDPEDVFGTMTNGKVNGGGGNDDEITKNTMKKGGMRTVKGKEAVEKLQWIQFKTPSAFGSRADKEKTLEEFNWTEVDE
jgi:hypothetical protein